jgi:hypothetical protein
MDKRAMSIIGGGFGNPIHNCNVPVYRMGIAQYDQDGDLRYASGSIGPWYPSEAHGLTPVEIQENMK